MPATAYAEPITVQLRLVPGDTVHYTVEAHMIVDSEDLDEPITFDYLMGLRLTVEEGFPDGSARVREVFDYFEFTGEDSDIDSSDLLGREFTFIARPDGSYTDFKVEGEDDSDSSLFNVLNGGSVSFPSQGLEVGQTVERVVPFPWFEPGQMVDVPIKTTLVGLLVEDGHPAAKMKQSYAVPEMETSFGPFGASGTMKIRMNGESTYSLDLATGWPLKMGGVVGYGMDLGRGDLGNFGLEMQFAMTLDELTLAQE
jgi:hypothetical protein